MPALVICGSRELSWHYKETIWSILDLNEHGLDLKNTLIVQGGARGADRHALDWAKARGYPWKTCEADWERYGRAAGIIRNEEQAEIGNYFIAFKKQGALNRGTDDMIERASAKGPVLVYTLPD